MEKEGGGEKAAVQPVSDYIIALQAFEKGLRKTNASKQQHKPSESTSQGNYSHPETHFTSNTPETASTGHIN